MKISIPNSKADPTYDGYLKGDTERKDKNL